VPQPAPQNFTKIANRVVQRWMRRSVRVAKATGTKTGQGESVGLFIPLPKDLAKQFPDLGKNDSSPSHVTFLYIGDFKDKEQQEKLVEVLRETMRKWWPGAKATLNGLEYFDHHDKDRRIPHVAVDFDKDLSGFKHRVKQELSDEGIEVGDKFPEFKPHVTLSYMPGMDSEWEGEVPEGSWNFDEMEVWGLPELHTIKLGPSEKKVAASWLRGKVAGWWAISPGNPGINPPPVDKGGLLNALPGTDPDSARYNGDGPADIMGNALAAVNQEYIDAWKRPATPEEMQAVFDFVYGGFERAPEHYLPKGDSVSLRVAARYMQSSVHRKNISLMKWLSQLTRRLGVGRDTYVVGGAVRNFLIDQPIKDIDIVIDTTKAGRDSDWLAKQIARNIPAPTNVTTNQYGVAILTVKGTWMIGGDDLNGEVLEIANARKESYGGQGGKGYKPHAVAPATIDEDVLRREFTFNTLLWRMMDLAHGPDKAEIIDLTGCGRRDLDQRVVRCPQDPDKVFSDDPTRMLRAIKFTGKYGFKIPPDVVRSIKRNVSKLKRMPWEAVASILVNDVMSQPTARKSLKQMKDLGLLDTVSEMIQEQKPFATYMSNQLRRNRKVQFLLDLLELGVPASTPISFLDRAGQQRLRDLTVSMPEKEAVAFVENLIKPPVDNKRIIDVLKLEGPDRRHITPTARHLILQNPELASKGQHLTDAVIKGLRK